jgi:hypothetical protein
MTALIVPVVIVVIFLPSCVITILDCRYPLLTTIVPVLCKATGFASTDTVN